MYAKIEPSGCEVWHSGLVKVRSDLFLEPDDARYDERHTLVPVIPVGGYPGLVDKDGRPLNQADYDDWLAKLPHVYQGPIFHSHYLRFEPDVSQEQVEQAILPHIANFYKAWTEECDKLPGGMRKGWDVATRWRAIGRPRRYDKEFSLQELGTRPAECQAKVDLIKASNLSVRSKGIGEIFPSTEIDVGAGATDRATYWQFGSYTLIDKNNAANDTGSLDTFELWFDTNYNDGAGVKVGTFENTAGADFTNRDVETIGTVTKGSKQTFSGKDCDVTSGDWVGLYSTSVGIEADTSGFSGAYYKSGDQFGAGSQTFTEWAAAAAFSIYATGDTPGWSNIAKVHGTTATDLAKINGVAVADVAKMNGVAV